LLIVGAGDRGNVFSNYALNHRKDTQVVAVAEPRELFRNRLGDAWNLPADRRFSDWKQIVAGPKVADAVVVTCPDALHAEVAIAFANKGYHMLLEKPMANHLDECKRIVEAVERAGIVFAVCHVLRYTVYTSKLKEIIDSGAIGEVVTVQHIEPVEFWHQAHSYVRGNWRNEATSSPMLLAKSCHDTDWLRFIIGKPCRKISSFGSLFHFRKEQRPAGATDRCLDCPVEATCPYSARRIYLQRTLDGQTGWPMDVITGQVTVENVTRALREGPYGRCVYACDNDVVDNQVVNMLFEGERTANFLMTAFSYGTKRQTHIFGTGRQTRIFGTRGELQHHGEAIHLHDFLTDKGSTIKATRDPSHVDTHGGGDHVLMGAFLHAVQTGDRSRILSGPRETLETHAMCFAAEIARRENRVVDMTEVL
jgi:predicted dehydrogenase